MITSKRRILSFVFTVLCFKKSLLIRIHTQNFKFLKIANLDTQENEMQIINCLNVVDNGLFQII